MEQNYATATTMMTTLVKRLSDIFDASGSKSPAVLVAAVLLLLAVFVIYLLGRRRRGNKKEAAEGFRQSSRGGGASAEGEDDEEVRPSDARGYAILARIMQTLAGEDRSINNSSVVSKIMEKLVCTTVSPTDDAVLFRMCNEKKDVLAVDDEEFKELVFAAIAAVRSRPTEQFQISMRNVGGDPFRRIKDATGNIAMLDEKKLVMEEKKRRIQERKRKEEEEEEEKKRRRRRRGGDEYGEDEEGSHSDEDKDYVSESFVGVHANFNKEVSPCTTKNPIPGSASGSDKEDFFAGYDAFADTFAPV